MAKWAVKRLGDGSLEVETPFPVTLAVWEDFVLKTFPEFHPSDRSHRPSDGYPNQYRYISRWSDKPVSVIGEGQTGNFYTHAYLPHLERTDRNPHSVGRFSDIPQDRLFYLAQIAGDLQDNPSSRAALLSRINSFHGQTLVRIFDMFDKKIAQFSGTDQEFRDLLLQNLQSEGTLSGSLQGDGESYQSSKPLGKLPVFMYNTHDIVRANSSLSFLRDLDSVLLGVTRETNRKLAPYQMVQVAARTHGLYDHMIPEDRRFKGVA